MLGISIESYEHVLGPFEVSLDSVRNKFFSFFKPFFNGLNGKFQNVIKEWSGVRFQDGWDHFQDQNNIITPRATFTINRAAEAPREAVFD